MEATRGDSIFPNNYGSFYIGNANVLPVKILVNGKEVTIPYEMLKRREENITNFVKKTQENNITVARSVLRSAVLSFLQFEKSFKSLLSKGDDSTQLYIIRKCINELEEANKPFCKIIEDPNFNWLPSHEDPRVSTIRELLEHCIKILYEVMPLIGGRNTLVNAYEIPVQAYGWKGWQQQSEQIKVSNDCLGMLLEENAPEKPDRVFADIMCFHRCITYIINGFFFFSLSIPSIRRD